MPNLVVNSKFKPFSYSEMLAPMAAYTDAYNLNELALGNIALESSVWEKLGENPVDAPTYKRYKDFQAQTELLINDLAKNGLTLDIRRNLLKTQLNYGKTIIPIKQAYEARIKLAEELLKALAQDQTLIFNRSANNTSLDEYIKNPVLGYKSISRDLITKLVASAVSNYKNQLRSSGKWSTTAGGQMLLKIELYGLAPEDINTIISNPEAFPELQQVIKNAVELSGVNDFKDTEAKALILNAALEGLWAGIGKSNVKEVLNQNFLNPYEQLKFSEALKESARLDEELKLKQLIAANKYNLGVNTQTRSMFEISDNFKLVKELELKLNDPTFKLSEDTPKFKYSSNTFTTSGGAPFNENLRFGYGSNIKYTDFLKQANIDPKQSKDKIKAALNDYVKDQALKYNSVKIPLDTEGKKAYLNTLMAGTTTSDDVYSIRKMDGTKITDKYASKSDLRDWLKDPLKFESVDYADWADNGRGGLILLIDGENYYVDPIIFGNESPKIFKLNSDLMKSLQKAIEDPTISEEEKYELQNQYTDILDNFKRLSVLNLGSSKIPEVNVEK